MTTQLMASKNQLFTPRDLVSTPVEGKSFLKLYPKRHIGDPWSELENNLAFNVNCSTLQNSNLKKNDIFTEAILTLLVILHESIFLDW